MSEMPANKERTGKQQRSRANLQTWKPGQSGNPSGRPKALAEVRDLARTHTVAAINTLADMLQAKNERVRVAAAEALLDRGWGKAPQFISIEENSVNVQISTAELISRFHDLIPGDIAAMFPDMSPAALPPPIIDVPAEPEDAKRQARRAKAAKDKADGGQDAE